MASIPPGSAVQLKPDVIPKLRLSAPSDELFVAVHRDALKSPQSVHTQVVALADSRVTWTAGLGEDLLEPRDARAFPAARAALGESLLTGKRLWEIILPGGLLRFGVSGSLSTIYHFERPWLVIGEAVGDQPIAVPLNDATNPKWYAPLVRAADLGLAGTKDAQLELAHAWTVRPSASTIGRLGFAVRAPLAGTITAYYT
jgi:hypothetical protein